MQGNPLFDDQNQDQEGEETKEEEEGNLPHTPCSSASVFVKQLIASYPNLKELNNDLIPAQQRVDALLSFRTVLPSLKALWSSPSVRTRTLSAEEREALSSWSSRIIPSCSHCHSLQPSITPFNLDQGETAAILKPHSCSICSRPVFPLTTPPPSLVSSFPFPCHYPQQEAKGSFLHSCNLISKVASQLEKVRLGCKRKASKTPAFSTAPFQPTLLDHFIPYYTALRKALFVLAKISEKMLNREKITVFPFLSSNSISKHLLSSSDLREKMLVEPLRSFQASTKIQAIAKGFLKRLKFAKIASESVYVDLEVDSILGLSLAKREDKQGRDNTGDDDDLWLDDVDMDLLESDAWLNEMDELEDSFWEKPSQVEEEEERELEEMRKRLRAREEQAKEALVLPPIHITERDDPFSSRSSSRSSARSVASSTATQTSRSKKKKTTTTGKQSSLPKPPTGAFNARRTNSVERSGRVNRKKRANQFKWMLGNNTES